VLIDRHVHLLPRRRLAGLMKWMHGFWPDFDSKNAKRA
jgi:hypothetical protein